jgi:hypothetical protein
MKNNVMCAAVVLSGFAFGAHAQSAVYTEATYWQLSSTSHASPSGTTSANGKVAAAMVGYQLNESFSLEGMLGGGLSSSDVKLNGATQTNPVTQELDLAYGAYVRAKTALTNDVEIFARVGRGGWHTTASTASASLPSHLYDWMYSAGLNYNINKSTYLTGSWASVYNKSSTKVDGYSLGLGFRF